MRKRNQYIIDGNITKIVINSKKYGVKYALIDTKNLEKVKEYVWCLNPIQSTGKYYAQSKIDGVLTRLHRFIINCENSQLIDHQNGDGLDNRMENLKVCNSKENQENRQGCAKNSNSGIRGVWWNEYMQKWRAGITHNKRPIHIGYFNTIKQAELAVIEARNKYFTNSIAC